MTAAIVVCFESGASNQALPTAAAAFTLLATSTAPAALTQPAPWVRWESPAERGSPVAGSVRESGRAAYIRIPLALSGPRFGLTCSISATTPVTSGVAMLVPERVKYWAEPLAP